MELYLRRFSEESVINYLAVIFSMREYIFVFGGQQGLGYLELLSYLKSRGIRYKILVYEKDMAVVLLPSGLDLGKLIRRLGGVVKIGEVFEEYVYAGSKDRLNYGISVYKGRDILSKMLKKEFKRKKVKAMLRRARNNVFMPSEIISKNLDEFIVYKNYKARTIAIFNPQEYRERDERRHRKILLHQVSLSLAKILINLSQVRDNLLDPFCGVGTILQEAMLNGLSVIGIDIDSESCEASVENLTWLKNKFKLRESFKIINGDAMKLTRYFDRNTAEGIASEPDMGPYFKKLPSKKQVEEAIDRLEKMYYEFLVQAREVIKKNGKIAMIIPILKFERGKMGIKFKEILSESGFRVVDLDKKVRFPIIVKDRLLDRLIYVLEKT